MIHKGNEWAALFSLTAEAVGPCASIMCDRHYRGEERTIDYRSLRA